MNILEEFWYVESAKPPDFRWEIRRFSFMVRNDYSSVSDIAICSGVMGSSRNHLPVARLTYFSQNY